MCLYIKSIKDIIDTRPFYFTGFVKYRCLKLPSLWSWFDSLISRYIFTKFHGQYI